MKKTSSNTEESRGTVAAGACIGVGVAGALACPPLAPITFLFGLFGAMFSKSVAASNAEAKLDETVEPVLDRLARQWANNRQPGETKVTLSHTMFTDDEFSMTRTNTYEIEDNDRVLNGVFSRQKPMLDKFPFEPIRSEFNFPARLDYQYPFAVDDLD